MSTKLCRFIDLLQREVENHSIYVWGASGQLCKDINEKWIREHESRSEGGKHADDAVAAWREIMDSPYADVARAFDCSGYVSYCLIQAKALDKRRDCDGLYSKCEPTDELRDGTLLFRVNKDDPSDETHVGVYIGGLQYHAKGRCFGVVRESYAPNYWAKKAWFKALPKPNVLLGDVDLDGEVTARDASLLLRYLAGLEELNAQQLMNADVNLDGKVTNEDADLILQYVVGLTTLPPKTKIHMTGNLCLREQGSKDSKRIGYCRKGKDYPLLGRADTGWYKTQVGDLIGFISDKTKYTTLI